MCTSICIYACMHIYICINKSMQVFTNMVYPINMPLLFHDFPPIPVNPARWWINQNNTVSGRTEPAF